MIRTKIFRAEDLDELEVEINGYFAKLSKDHQKPSVLSVSQSTHLESKSEYTQRGEVVKQHVITTVTILFEI